jgi:hypothetical protein
MANTPKSPGRPVKDKALREIISNPPVPNSGPTNDQLVYEYLGGRPFVGCEVSACPATFIYGPVWRCQFYVAGKQRVIARGTLFQCAGTRKLAHRFWTCGKRDLSPPVLEYFSKLDEHFTSGREITTTLSRIVSLEKRISALEQRIKPNPKYVSINP